VKEAKKALKSSIIDALSIIIKDEKNNKIENIVKKQAEKIAELIIKDRKEAVKKAEKAVKKAERKQTRDAKLAVKKNKKAEVKPTV
jgi:hypothetical protein